MGSFSKSDLNAYPAATVEVYTTRQKLNTSHVSMYNSEGGIFIDRKQNTMNLITMVTIPPVDEIDYEQFITEDDTPVDNLFSDQQQYVFWLRWCDQDGIPIPIAREQRLRADHERKINEKLSAKLRTLGIDPKTIL